MDSRARRIERTHALSRRTFLRGAAGASLAGAGVVLLGACRSDDSNRSPTVAAEPVADPPPETTTIRLGKGLETNVNVCAAPVWLSEQFLPAEGFTSVQYIASGPVVSQQLSAGEIDIGFDYAASVTAAADAGDQLVLLTGAHPTCYDLFGNDRVQSLRDLKGKRIQVFKADPTDGSYVFMATLLAYVGIDLEHEVEFVELSSIGDVVQAVDAGTIDALLVPPPYSTHLRTNNLGLHVVVDGMMDAPWSHYFCCMATGNKDFVEKHPAATKRALRAILKAADVCAREPERAAHYLVDKGYTQNYDDALDEMTRVSYAAWRQFDPEDTVRFFALRLKEAGIVKRTPDELIARATDWRYLEQIKRELGVA